MTVVELVGAVATVVLLVLLVQRTRGPHRFGAPLDLDEHARACRT